MNITFPIYNVIVVGFHHKRGCQVEFAFPPLETELENTAWKHLPTLAMPDGAHNYDRDTVYFHLPSLENPHETVFGVACYQQIDADKLKKKTDDVTRSTVQKSVCVLSRYPLYGHIQVKMQLITAAYFREGDFQQVSLLEEAYHNLNACLTSELLNTPEAFVGLSPRELVFTFRHQILILFKLLLLEKRILFRGASVGPLCSALLTLVSLLPCSVEHGLNESACVKTSKSYSVVPQFSTSSSQSFQGDEKDDNEKEKQCGRDEDDKKYHEVKKSEKEQNNTQTNNGLNSSNDNKIDRRQDIKALRKNNLNNSSSSQSLKNELDSSANVLQDSSSVDSPVLENKFDDVIPDFLTAVQISATEAGFPLEIFTKGYLCHPYLSLNYLDLLNDTRVKGFIVGATNILFKQKKDLVDVTVEMQDGSIDIQDPNLKRIVTLTTQDLRFAENIVKQVTQESSGKKFDDDSFMSGVGWEGGDEWIRAQFRYYLICLMRTSLAEENNRLRDCFGSGYLLSWQNTAHWKKWNEYVNSEARDTPGIYSICAGHPNDGNISINDMRLKISHTMQNSKGGQAVSQAVASTGRAVAQTGKAVGATFSQAKGALSSFWTQITTPTVTASDATEAAKFPNSSSGGNFPNSSSTSTTPTNTTTTIPSPSENKPQERQSVFHIDNID